MSFNNKGIIVNDVKKLVDDVINHVGKDITFGMTLALGKPVRFINELYRRAKEDPSIKLKILTALPLEKPRGQSELELRFLRPLVDRVFDGVPELDYMVDFREGNLPSNVEPYEFFSRAGINLHSPQMQMNHLASNYTHACRDAADYGTNVFGQLIAHQEIDGQRKYSMACNPDICLEATATLRKQREKEGKKVAIIGEANKKMPFMYGDAVVDPVTYDFILHGEEYDYTLFGAPKDAVALSDHMIGINVSTLVRDGGTIQVGIGALGDAIVAGLIMRNEHNDIFQEIIQKANILKRYAKEIEKWGGTETFEQGLYGSSEMFIDAFMQMYKSHILKRRVYESVPLMKLINSGALKVVQDAPGENHTPIPDDILETLIKMKGIHSQIDKDNFKFLCEYGILKTGLNFENGTILDGDNVYATDLSDANNLKEIKKLLGKKLINGHVIMGAFFLGPQAFYKALNDMSEEERAKFSMCPVEKVNQLYGGEELRALQRKGGSFVNAGMIATLLGAAASDQLEDGKVVSGVGGQYNFNAMAHALPDGRFILMIESTKGSGKSLTSNIRFNYGHCTITKHNRDIIVTEYGIAFVRGKPDQEVIMEMLKVADSRFQQELMKKAKKAGKLAKDYEIPAEYRNNYPEKIIKLLKPYQDQGYFKLFPFGTDFTDDDIALGGSLRAMKALSSGTPLKLATGLLSEFFKPIPQSAQRHIKRMKLDKPASLKEKIYRKMVVFALRNNNRL